MKGLRSISVVKPVLLFKGSVRYRDLFHAMERYYAFVAIDGDMISIFLSKWNKVYECHRIQLMRHSLEWLIKDAIKKQLKRKDQ